MMSWVHGISGRGGGEVQLRQKVFTTNTARQRSSDVILVQQLLHVHLIGIYNVKFCR